MTFHYFEAPHALTSGSELWLVADLDSSRWACKVDWYLNFQLARAQVHNSPDISRELNEIATRWDFDVKAHRAPAAAPLLIASVELLPNLTTVMVPFGMPVDATVSAGPKNSRKHDWAQRCFKIWQQLGHPRLRIFMPDNMTGESFEKTWNAALVADGAVINKTIEIVRPL